MSNLLVLLVCFALGALARRFTQLPPETPRVLNAWVLWVSLPALVLRTAWTLPLQPRAFVYASTLWLLFALVAAVGLLAVRRGWCSPAVAGAMVLCCGLGNTAFVGLPLLEALGGPAALHSALVADQLGTFVALSLLAVPFAMHLGGGGVRVPVMLARMARFPPLLALVLGVCLRAFSLPTVLDGALERLASMLSPLALASLGWQLEPSAVRGHGRALALGLAYKLVLGPALVCLLLRSLGPLGFEARVTVAQAAMAPMVTAGVLATEYRLAPTLAAALLAVGVPLSVLTVPLWWRALEALAR